MYYNDLEKLKTSRFRRKFCLTEQEKLTVKDEGLDKMRQKAEFIVSTRLQNPINDGHQTPYFGHPIFKAQHATATCCRKCVNKWWRFPMSRELNEQEFNFVVGLIIKWLRTELRK